MKCDKSFRLNDSKIIHISVIACDVSCCLFSVGCFFYFFSVSLFLFWILTYQTFCSTFDSCVNFSFRKYNGERLKESTKGKTEEKTKQSKAPHTIFKNAIIFHASNIILSSDNTLPTNLC